MPAYNAAAYLTAAVESVINQSWPQWELLLVDDASTDDTLAIARGLARRDSRVRVLQQSRNGGVAAARNRALAEAAGSHIAFLDSDDLWLPEKLESQLRFMESTGCPLCYSAYRRMDEQGRDLGTVRPPPVVNYETMLRSNFIGNLTGIYDAEVLGKQWFSDFRHEDYIAWLELIKRAGEARGLQEPLAYYRVYTGSASSNKFRAIAWQWRIYRHSQALGLLRSSKYMIYYAFYAILKRRG